MKKGLILAILVLGFVLSVNMVALQSSSAVGDFPYSVYGQVFDSDGLKVVGAEVTLTVDRTDEVMEIVSDTNGTYSFEFLNLVDGYNDADKLIIEVHVDNYPASENESAFIITSVDGDKAGERLDIDTAPPREDFFDITDFWLWIVGGIIVVIIIALVIVTIRRSGKSGSGDGL